MCKEKERKIQEQWYEYNENNNLIYHKTSNGYESWYKYNEYNNLIYFKISA